MSILYYSGSFIILFENIMSAAKAVFTEGSVIKHIIVMASTSAIGLLSLFIVDLLDMYFLSLLGEPEIVAAVGFSGALLFLLFSLSIGLQIGLGALVAKAEGARDRELAGRYCTNALIFSFITIGVLTFIAWFLLEDMLTFVGAKGLVLEYAMSYSRILLPSIIIVPLSMGSGAALRSIGDVKRSMMATLSGGLVNAVLDPIFIFVFDWGLEGAAIASVCARVSVFLFSFGALIYVHKLPKATNFKLFVEDFPLIARIAFPAMATNLMTPIGGAFVLKTMAEFGDAAVAGYAVLGRIIPVAFAGIFSLSGAIGPVIGQNVGAGNYHRVHSALIDSIKVVTVYVVCIWLILYSMQGVIVSVFDIKAEGAEVIIFYTTYLVGLFFFAGLLFIANASFNNLDRAHYATLFNFLRTFLGTIPVVYFMSQIFGLKGALMGDLVGGVVFGSLAFIVALRRVEKLKHQNEQV